VTLARSILTKLSVDNPSPALKQMPTSIAFAAAVVIALVVPSVGVSIAFAVVIGIVLMIAATLIAVVLSRQTSLERYAIVVPCVSVLAIGYYRSGTGGTGSLFTGLIILPIVWIAAQKGRRYILVAIIGTSVALMLTYVIEWRLPADGSEWLRGIFTPVVFGLAGAIVNELSRQGRRQLESIRTLAAERELILSETVSYAQQLHVNESKLRAADRLTRSVLDAVTEQSVIGTDLTGLIEVWNPGASAMLGLSPAETQGKRYVFDFHVQAELEERSRELNYPPGATVLNPGFSALVESARLGRAEVREWTYVRADGATLAVQVAVTPRADEDGSIIGYIFVGTDVTQALEVSRLKDEFVGLISHELRTPLSSILGYLELMRDEEDAPLSTEQLKYLGVAERNAHRLLRLVGDLLFTAQVGAGKFPLEVSEVDLRTIVTAALISAEPAASAAGVELLDRAADQALLVRGDPVRLGQACDNLISNAIKFTPRGGSVTVGLDAREDAAVVTVRDTGIGIAASELDQLYSRFFRATTATRNALPGVGLGLTITKAIVTAHGGELDVESEEGVGTQFSMSIPRVPVAVR
jgi:signal transduction histidine kinase